jgi:AcrR family transcriptional regulator
MSKPAGTRERLLDAYEELLIEHGERGATLDAVAHRADVSKGGLLYHFGSKDALTQGLVDRLQRLTDQDVETMRQAPGGPVEYLIRTSINTNSPLDAAITAVARLAQTSAPRVSEALAEMRQKWLDLILETVPDAATARAIVLISDGLYYNSALLGVGFDSGKVTQADLDDLVRVVRRLTD